MHMWSFRMTRNGDGVRSSNSSSSSKMIYRMKKVRGRSRGNHLISVACNLSPVILVGVFIITNLVNCARGQESLQSTSENPPTPPPASEIAVKENINGNVQPISKSADLYCDHPPRMLNGKKTVSCRSYTTIPTDIIDPQDVQVLNMDSGNTLQTLGKDQLVRSKLGALSILNLQNCGIRTIERGVFAVSNIITDLDLSKNNIEVLDPEVFSGLNFLIRLNLQNNPINRFQVEAMFPPLQRLATLDLSTCSLDTVPISVMDNLKNVKTIRLNSNRLRKLDWRVFQNTKKLDEVGLAGNPWHCDCHVKFLMEFLQESSLSPGFQQATCASTAKITTTFIGAKWQAVPIDEMTCNPTIEKLNFEVLKRSGVPETQEEGKWNADNDIGNVKLDSDVYFECEYTGHPRPNIKWLKDNRPIVESVRIKNQPKETRAIWVEANRNNKTTSDQAESSTSRPQLLPRIQFQDSTSKMEGDEEKNNYKFRESLILRRVKAEDSGTYSCIVNNVGGLAEKMVNLNVTAPHDVLYGAILPGGKKGIALWMWILIALLSILILLLITLLTCLIWKRREKRKQEGFRKVVQEKFKDSKIDLGDFNISTSTSRSQETRVDGATPLLDNRSESSTLPISDNRRLPDVAIGNEVLVRNSAIFSPKPPPSHNGYPGDDRKEFFARQISEPYLRPGSAMSLTRPGTLTASQRRYIFANQPYQSEPTHGEIENMYAVPSHVREIPRSGSAMSVSALPEYDLRRQLFLRQYSQPQSQYATASRLPNRRPPSTSSEPPLENMARAFSYSTLPRRPIRVQNWSRPVSPTNSTCSTYSTLSWRPNVDPRTGVVSDGMGLRNTALGGSITSVNKIPDMSGAVIGEGNGPESVNRAMLTPAANGGKVKSARNPRYGHSRTPSSLTRGHNDFFSFEPIQEVESSECASIQNLDRAGQARQTPAGYSTQSLARGEPRYKRKKPPPIKMIPTNLKTPSRAFEHLKGRSISPALRDSIVNGDPPTEQLESQPTTTATTAVPEVNNSNTDASSANNNVPVLESPIDEEVKTSSSKVPPPPPPPKPKRQNQEEEEGIPNGSVNETKHPNATSDGTVV